MRKTRATTFVSLPPKCSTSCGQSHCDDRWTTWAQALKGRHTRIAIRHQTLTFIMARTQSSCNTIAERWQYLIKQLPTIRLSIGPILLRFGDTAIRSLLAMPPVTTATAQRKVTREFVYSKPEPGEQLSVQQKPFTSTRNDGAYKASRARLHDILFSSPLMRVFGRDVTTASAPRVEAQLLSRGSQLYDRVLKGRRRIEENVRRNLVNREQHATGSATPKAIAENTVFESSHTRRSGMPGPDFSGWPIDIGRLTEQVVRNIDNRIIAHRERTGRVF
jgi:hypothetical protein